MLIPQHSVRVSTIYIGTEPRQNDKQMTHKCHTLVADNSTDTRHIHVFVKMLVLKYCSRIVPNVGYFYSAFWNWAQYVLNRANWNIVNPCRPWLYNNMMILNSAVIRCNRNCYYYYSTDNTVTACHTAQINHPRLNVSRGTMRNELGIQPRTHLLLAQRQTTDYCSDSDARSR